MRDPRPPLPEPDPAAPVPRPAEPDDVAGPARHADDDRADAPDPPVEPLRLPLLPRRSHPWLLVEVDDSPAGHGALVWALREAARREATVLAVTVLDECPEQPLGGPAPSRRDRAAALRLLEARVLRAIAETGVHGRSRTAVLDRPVLEALRAAVGGADLVVVGAESKTVLRPAVARPPFRRLPRGA